MSLEQRLGPKDGVTAGVGDIAVHQFYWGVTLVAAGTYTTAQFKTYLSATFPNKANPLALTAQEETQIDELATHYGTLSAEDKSRFPALVEASVGLYREGDVTWAQLKTILGFTTG